MAWDTTLPVIEVAQQLMNTRLRVERLRLAQIVNGLEKRAQLQGLPVDAFQKIRAALNQVDAPGPQSVDRALVLPRKPKGVWRKTYLTVQSKPGSIF